MNLTYIILAHKNPKQLYRLVYKLSSDFVNFVIHVDNCVDISDFFQPFEVHDVQNVFFMENRSKSEWGSFGLVDAVLNALKLIVEKLPLTNRIVLLSGQDYPVKSNRYIYQFLSANPDKIYMEHFKLPYRNWREGGLERFPFYEEIVKDLTLYGGSQWMSFPYAIAELILHFLTVNPEFKNYFMLVKIPDESFFQTLLLNCGIDSVKRNIINKNLHYIKWEYPYLHPKFIGWENWKQLCKTKNLFTRKVRANYPTLMLDRIDNELLTLNLGLY